MPCAQWLACTTKVQLTWKELCVSPKMKIGDVTIWLHTLAGNTSNIYV